MHSACTHSSTVYSTIQLKLKLMLSPEPSHLLYNPTTLYSTLLRNTFTKKRYLKN